MLFRNTAKQSTTGLSIGEQVSRRIGHARSPFDILIIRQVDESGASTPKGTILRFDHNRGEDGKLIGPETGEEITLDDLTINLND